MNYLYVGRTRLKEKENIWIIFWIQIILKFVNALSMTVTTSIWLILLQKESVDLHDFFYIDKAWPKEKLTTF